MASRSALAAVERERDDAIARHAEDRRHWEEQRREDQHHFRNVLAIVRAMIRRAADDAADVEMYCGQLDGRLAAYIQVQALIARDGEVDLETLIADELLRFGVRLGEGAELVGEPVAISHGAAGLLALFFHELIADFVYVAATPAHPLSEITVRWDGAVDGSLTIECVRHFGKAPPPHEGAWIDWVREALTHQLRIDVEQLVEREEQRTILRIPRERIRTQ